MVAADFKFPESVKSVGARSLYLHDAIRYEEHEGVHTFHACDCGRGLCRSSMCAKCWRDAGKRFGIIVPEKAV